MEIKTIGIASDHAGFALKQFVKKYLEEKGYQYKDYGTYNEESCDYSDFGHALAEGIEQGEVFPGIAICGSGEGINMTLNKHQSIRAGLCWIPEIAHLIRQHNNANVLVMPGRFIDEDMARKIMDEYFTRRELTRSHANKKSRRLAGFLICYLFLCFANQLCVK